LAVSSARQKQDALLYALKVSVFLVLPVAYLSALALAALLKWFSDWSFYQPLLLWPLWPALGSAIGVAFPTYRSYRNLLNPEYNKSSSVDRAYKLTLNLPYQQAYQRCLESLSAFGNVRILIADIAHDRIGAALIPEPFWRNLFKTSARISFRLGSNQEGITEVEVVSRAPLSTAVFDFSGHQRNLRRISAFLEQNAVSSAL
jgi:hypothetical protein